MRGKSLVAFALSAALTGCEGFIVPMQPPPPKSPSADKPGKLEGPPFELTEKALEVNDLARAEQILAEALGPAPAEGEALSLERAQLLGLAAELRIRQGRFEDGARNAVRALPLLPPTGTPSIKTQRGLHLRLAEAYENAGRDGDAVTHLLASRDICRSDAALPSTDACEVERKALFRIYIATGRYSDAEPLVLERISEVQARAGSNTLRMSEALCGAADFYCRQGKYALCGPLYARSIDIWKTFRDDALAEHRRALETNQPSPFDADFTRIRARHAPFTVPCGLHEQASILYKLGKPEVAAQAIDFERRLWTADAEVAPRAMETLGALTAAAREGIELALANETLGFIHFKRGDYPNALVYYTQARTRLASSWPTTQRAMRRVIIGSYLDILENMQTIARAEGRFADAVLLGREAIDVAAQEVDAKDALRLDTISLLATTYREMRDLGRAEEFAVRYMNDIQAARGTSNPDYAWALRNLSFVALLQDQIPRSDQLEKQAKAIWVKNVVVAPEF
ncbi:MAG TPA: hypothetical protein VEL28_00680 [Candidatus Binatia bacterium]|nr:hypothetical protein [Candidatus Binatia bacterium]